MKVWIFQTGEPLHIDVEAIRPMRAMNLADNLIANGHDVTIWSSCFFHQKKEHRYNDFQSILFSKKLKINLIPSKGYVKNIGINRLLDHFQMGFNLENELNNVPKAELPSVAFIGYPPIEFAYKASKFLNKKKIPYMLDAKDMWPDYFIEKIPKVFRIFGKLIFMPWFLMAHFIFRNAVSFSTISEGFMSWMLKLGKRELNSLDCIAPTSTSYSDLSNDNYFNLESEWEKFGVNFQKDKIFFYAGTLNKTLDFEAIKYASKYYLKNNQNVKFIICGNGPENNILEKMFIGLDNVLFTGWVERKMLYVLASKSIASIIPYKNSKSFTSGIPNKFSDALSLGVPIISSLDGEVRSLIGTHKVGQHYKLKSYKTFVDAINNYLDFPEVVEYHSNNSTTLYNLMFNKNSIYKDLVNKLEIIAS